MNLNKMTREEKKEFLNGYCKHRMPYLQHPKCYEKEKALNIKVGYLDIEAGGLNANFDIMLCYYIKTRDKDEYETGRVIKQDYLNESLDKRICQQLIKDIQKYDVIITYYGTKYDIPFIRSRCLSHKLNFPEFGMIKHKDVYYMVKSKMRLHRNSLESACALLNIKGKDHIKGNYWMLAKYCANEEALTYIHEHCKKDVIILERLHKKIEIFVKNTLRSI